MIALIQRYLAANFIIPLVGSCVFFVFFLLTFQMFRVTQLIMAKDVPIVEVGSLLLSMAISFIPMAIPLSILFSMIFSLGRLSDDSEIVAARSFGLSRERLFFPYLTVGLIMALITLLLNVQVIPASRKEFKTIMLKLTSTGMLSNIKPEQFFTEIPGITLYSETVDGDGKILGNVFIHMGDQEKEEEQIILAKRGVLVKHGQESVLNMRLHLFNGNITKTKVKSNQVEKILFDEYDFPVFQNDARPEAVNKDSTWSSYELWKVIRERKDKLREFQSIKKQRELGQEEKDIEEQTKRDVSILSFGLGIKKGRGKSRNTGVIALLLLILYYSVLFFGIAMAKKGQLYPGIANFAPTLMLFGFGVYYYRKFDWAS
ncbi:MAG: LptF/LptG family permease [Bdellovibrio sp.]|nr:LptF/LptG family permease [Bdellovibrio sp.]